MNNSQHKNDVTLYSVDTRDINSIEHHLKKYSESSKSFVELLYTCYILKINHKYPNWI